jgi:hypothetical protein
METAVTAQRGGDSASVQATCVGGDFFFFHDDLRLKYGSFFGPDTLARDVVVIDESLAWRLFGAANVVGFPITVAGQPCYVAGVVAAPEGFPGAATYGAAAYRLFAPFEVLEQSGQSVPATVYEIVLPDPVTRFGVNLVQEALTAPEGSYILRENSARYDFSSLLATLRALPGGAARGDSVVFPWWENAALRAQSWAALALMLAALAAVYPAAQLIIALIRVARSVRRLPPWIRGRVRARQMRVWQAKNPTSTSTPPPPAEAQLSEEEVLL